MREAHQVGAQRRLLLAAEIRRIETAHQAEYPQHSLMRRAARAAVIAAEALCQSGGRILVLAGPGNNGGDAWVMARLLQQAWYAVSVIEIAAPKAAEARSARAAFLEASGKILTDWPSWRPDLIVDGLLGIGLSRAPDAVLAHWIERTNQSGSPVLALDVPSGLHADTGIRPGPCIHATQTITFIANKPGLHTGHGSDHAGEVSVADLDLGVEVEGSPGGTLLQLEAVRGPLPVRTRNSHKGNYGAVGVIGGATGMAGALTLASRAALLLGAGKVFHAALCEYSQGQDPVHPEIMFRRPRDVQDEESLSAMVVGPGLGTGDLARNLLASLLKINLPMVLDADALNLVAKGRALQTALTRREAPTILTPHPAEAARLLDTTTAEVNGDRVVAARALGQKFKAVSILKGSGSVIAAPDGDWFINPTGNPGMASAGMGDVLSGMLGALLAQGMSAIDAACLGVCLHGAAADAAVADGKGPAGLTASEVALAARSILNR